MDKKVIGLILIIGVVSEMGWAEEGLIKKMSSREEDNRISTPKEKIKGSIITQADQKNETIPSAEELEKARKDREERLKEIGYTPPQPQDVPVKEEDIQRANKAREEMLRKMGIDPNAPKIKAFSEDTINVSAQEVEKANKDREERLKEIGYTPPLPRDVPVKEEDIQKANKARDEMLRKMGIDPNAPKKAEVPSWYKPIEPTKEELDKNYNLHLQKEMEDQKKLFDEAMEYKKKGELKEALATLEKMEGRRNSPIIEEAVREKVKIQKSLGLLEGAEEPERPKIEARRLLPDEIPKDIKYSSMRIKLMEEKKKRLEDEK